MATHCPSVVKPYDKPLTSGNVHLCIMGTAFMSHFWLLHASKMSCGLLSPAAQAARSLCPDTSKCYAGMCATQFSAQRMHGLIPAQEAEVNLAMCCQDHLFI